MRRIFSIIMVPSPLRGSVTEMIVRYQSSIPSEWQTYGAVVGVPSVLIVARLRALASARPRVLKARRDCSHEPCMGLGSTIQRVPQKSD
jgi:hypothetical protein